MNRAGGVDSSAALQSLACDNGLATLSNACRCGATPQIACTSASTPGADEQGTVHCGTSYATPMVAGLAAAMLSINPQLQPEQLRMLLRRSAMTIGDQHDFERSDAQDLTAPILPSERNYQLDDKDVGRSARLDMQKALDLAVQSRTRVR